MNITETRKTRIVPLKVEKPRFYDRRFPYFHPPREIGCFSKDSDGKYQNGGHQMKYLSMPEKMKGLHMDLNEGFNEYIDKREDREATFDSMLKWILLHQDDVKQNFIDHFASETIVDFVLCRDVVTKCLSKTVYEQKEDWMLQATKFKSVIYFRTAKTRRRLEEAEKETLSEKELRMRTWGFKFEQYMVSDAPHLKPDTSIPVNENEEYYSMVKGKLGSHRLLFCAELDAVDPKQASTAGPDSSSMLRYTELKTTRIITNGKQKSSFQRYKLRNWYIQSFLAGIPQVICGFRDDEGIVRQLQVFNV